MQQKLHKRFLVPLFREKGTSHVTAVGAMGSCSDYQIAVWSLGLLDWVESRMANLVVKCTQAKGRYFYFMESTAQTRCSVIIRYVSKPKHRSENLLIESSQTSLISSYYLLNA